MGVGNGAAFMPYLVAINIGVGLLVAWAVWAFRSGRWVEEQTSAHAELLRQITAARDEHRRDMSEVKTALAEEHRARLELAGRCTESLIAVSTQMARHDERLKTLEQR